jgi:hypothetical protein
MADVDFATNHSMELIVSSSCIWLYSTREGKRGTLVKCNLGLDLNYSAVVLNWNMENIHMENNVYGVYIDVED